MVKKCLYDKRKSIYLFLLVFVSYSLIYMTKNCYSAAMASIVAQGIMTKSQTGFIAAMFYLIYAPFQIVGGIAADRISPSKLLLFGTFGAGVCNALVYFFSENYIAMLIIWSANAILQFGIWPAVFKIIVSQLKEEHRAKGVYFIAFSSSVGLACSYVLASFIEDWKMNFLISAIALFALVGVFFFCYSKLERGMKPCESIAKTNSIKATEPENGRKKQKIKAKAKEKGDWEMVGIVIKSGVPLLLFAYVVQGLLNIGLKSLVPVMLMESYDNVSSSLANSLNVIIVFAGPVGLIFGGMPFFKKLSYPTVLSILFASAIPFAIILTFIGSVSVAVIVCSLVLLIITMSAMSIYFSLTSKVFERYGLGGTLSGIFNCMSALGMMLANYVFTKIAEDYGWGVTTKAWLVIAAVTLVLVLVAVPLWKRFLRQAEAE